MINQEFREKTEKVFDYFYIFVCSFLMSLFYTNNPFQIGKTGSDSSVFIYVAKVMIDGGMPYRDTFDHKGPLIYLIDALGLLLNNQIGIWILELITIFIIFLFSYKIARLLQCSRPLSCLIVTIGISVLSWYFEDGNLTEEYACAFITISLYIFLKYFLVNHIEKYEIVICGMSFAAVCMLRINMIAVWIVMCVAVVGSCIHSYQQKFIPKFVVLFLFGATLVIVPIVIWLIQNSAFYEFINDYFIFNFKYSSDSERASLDNIINAVKFFILGGPASIAFSFLGYLIVKKNAYFDWLCACVLILSILMSSISGQKSYHYGMIFYPCIIYAFARFFYEFSITKVVSLRDKTAHRILFILYLCLCGTMMMPFCKFLVNYMPEMCYANTDVLSNEKKIATIIQAMTDKEDRITVIGNGNIYYLLSNRKSASKYSYQYPIAGIDSKIWEEYLGNIQNERPKMIIALPYWHNVRPYCEAKIIIDKHYNLLNIVADHEIYLLKTE